MTFKYKEYQKLILLQLKTFSVTYQFNGIGGFALQCGKSDILGCLNTLKMENEISKKG